MSNTGGHAREHPQGSQPNPQSGSSKGPRHSLRPSATGGMEAVKNPSTGGHPQQRANTGGFGAQAGGHPTRGPNTGPQPVSNTGSTAQQSLSNTGSMGEQRPITGGQSVQNPDSAGFRKDTSGFVPVQTQRSEPEEVDFQLRIIYAGSGFGLGLMLGIGLGLLNSVLEGIEPMAGLGLTLQIAVWLGLIIGIVAGWKPRRFDNAWDRLMSGLGLGD